MKNYRLTYVYANSNSMSITLYADNLYDLALIRETVSLMDLVKEEKGITGDYMSAFIFEQYDFEAKEWFEWVDLDAAEDSDDTSVLGSLKRTSPSEYAKINDLSNQLTKICMNDVEDVCLEHPVLNKTNY